VLALAGAIAAFVFLQDYLVYGDDGQVWIELPHTQVKETETEVSAPPDKLIIVTATPAPENITTPQPAPEVTPDNIMPEPTPDAVPGVVPSDELSTPLPEEMTPAPTSTAPVSENAWRALMLSEDELTGSPPTAERLEGYHAIVLDMKGDDGWLRFASQSEHAKGLETSSAESGRNAAIEAITATDTYTIARISCFRDYRAPRRNNNLALRSSQGNWVDPDEMRWLNPSIEEARAYVVEVCVELAGMGFDEILLDNAFYPFEGNVNRIRQNKDYDPDNLNVPIEAFYQEVKAACPGVKVSVVTTSAGLLPKESNRTGQSAELLAQYADRVYVRTETEDALREAEALLTAAGLGPEQIVCWHAAGETSLLAGGGEAVYLP